MSNAAQEPDDAEGVAEPPMLPASPATYTAAFRNHPAGVAVVTAEAGGPVALTISSLSSVSVDPPILMFSASHKSSGARALRYAETLVVHLIGSDHLWLAQLGATSGIDRFADKHAWTRLETGEPVYHGVFPRIRGKVIERVAAGNSTVLLVEVLEIAEADSHRPHAQAPPLAYHDRTWHRLGRWSAMSWPSRRDATDAAHLVRVLTSDYADPSDG